MPEWFEIMMKSYSLKKALTSKLLTEKKISWIHNSNSKCIMYSISNVLHYFSRNSITQSAPDQTIRRD